MSGREAPRFEANEIESRWSSGGVPSHAMAAGGPISEELKVLLSNGDLTGERLNRAVALLEEGGSRAWTQQLADEHLRAALDELEGDGLASGSVRDLREIAQFVVQRDF